MDDYVCFHLIQPSPDSYCRQNLCSTCSQMGRCSVSQEGGLEWCLCTCKYITLSEYYTAVLTASSARVIHIQTDLLIRKIGSPEKGILQVQKITGLRSCLIHLGNNTDVIALSVGKKIKNLDTGSYCNEPCT